MHANFPRLSTCDLLRLDPSLKRWQLPAQPYPDMRTRFYALTTGARNRPRSSQTTCLVQNCCGQDKNNMPKLYYDYYDMYLTHDSPPVRKTRCGRRKHKENTEDYDQKRMEEQAQGVADKQRLDSTRKATSRSTTCRKLS
ncbi:hypothetical protein U0070_019903 [Myodes glareolus]|uniref:U1-C C2H2-type zinc finger domain-containing protein n=1 Tax=Myodes glareolus TaxID=447135 RepID=A0AAW0JK94_MYOGA